MTMQVIQHIEVGAGGATSIEFSAIPQTFTDIVIKLSARERDSGDYVRFYLDINGTNSSITSRYLFSTGTNRFSSTGTNLVGYGVNRVSATSQVYGNTDIYIPSYTSNRNKAISIDGVEENNAAAAIANISAAEWVNTAAITSIAIISPGNFLGNSSATLLGITAGSDGITTVS